MHAILPRFCQYAMPLCQKPSFALVMLLFTQGADALDERVGKASNLAGQVEPRLIFAETVFDQQRKLLHGMGGLFASSADRHITALGRAQTNQAHQRRSGHGLPTLSDPDSAGYAPGKRADIYTKSK